MLFFPQQAGSKIAFGHVSHCHLYHPLNTYGGFMVGFEFEKVFETKTIPLIWKYYLHEWKKQKQKNEWLTMLICNHEMSMKFLPILQCLFQHKIQDMKATFRFFLNNLRVDILPPESTYPVQIHHSTELYINITYQTDHYSLHPATDRLSWTCIPSSTKCSLK